jgi:hypothetical protein
MTQSIHDLRSTLECKPGQFVLELERSPIFGRLREASLHLGCAVRHKVGRSLISSGGSSPTSRCKELQAAFESLGLPAATQSYRFLNSTRGCNAYATIRAPKTDGSESIVLAASWKSRGGGRLHTRGSALICGLAHHLSSECNHVGVLNLTRPVELSLWFKDIILLVADDYIEGSHAFLAGVHDVHQSSEMGCQRFGSF